MLCKVSLWLFVQTLSGYSCCQIAPASISTLVMKNVYIRESVLCIDLSGPQGHAHREGRFSRKLGMTQSNVYLPAEECESRMLFLRLDADALRQKLL